MNTENKPAAIDPKTPFFLMDSQTKKVVEAATYGERQRLRRLAERKNQAHGAVRYVCRFV